MNHGWTYTDTIGRGQAGTTALDFYAATYRHSGAATWRARLLAGEMSRNGAPLAPGDVLADGDRLEWRRPPWNEEPVPRHFGVIYEDDAVVAVDKPAGLPVVPSGGFLENTLVSLLAARYPGETVAPAHRLNRGTSGLVLCSRTPAAARSLAAQFREKTAGRGELRKKYLALTVPLPGHRVGETIEIDTPIGIVPHPLLGRVHAADPRGRPSRSVCTILGTGPRGTLWHVDLITGRPHQIRIHLASIGAPLKGDPLFAAGGMPLPFALPADTGYFLRAVEISFVHPVSGQAVRVSVAEELENYLDLCAKKRQNIHVLTIMKRTNT